MPQRSVAWRCPLFVALQPSNEIILAVNPQVTIDVIIGILQAAKDTEQIVILELELSEMDHKGGYTGLTLDLAEKSQQKIIPIQQ